MARSTLALRGDYTKFATLATADHQQATLPIDVVDVQVQQFGGAQARAEQQQQHTEVAPSDGGFLSHVASSLSTSSGVRIAFALSSAFGVFNRRNGSLSSHSSSVNQRVYARNERTRVASV